VIAKLLDLTVFANFNETIFKLLFSVDTVLRYGPNVKRPNEMQICPRCMSDNEGFNVRDMRIIVFLLTIWWHR